MKPPFVHLLRTPFSDYIFDVNTDTMVQIDEDAYQYIQNNNDKNSHNIQNDFQSELLNDLVENGYLSPHKPAKIEDARVDDIEYYLSHKLNQLTLQVTQNCNFRCSYCSFTHSGDVFNRTHSNQSMSVETAKRAVDFYAKRVRDSNMVSIAFYGGEPLIEFELIKSTVKYAKVALEGKPLTFNMTTNATLFTTEMMDFFVEHKFILMISIDGPKTHNDTGRKYASDGSGTFDSIMKSIKIFHDRHPEYYKSISFNCVLDPLRSADELNRFFESPLFIHNEINTPIVQPKTGSFVQPSVSFRHYEIISQVTGLLSFSNYMEYSKLNPLAKNYARLLTGVIKFISPIDGLPDRIGHGGPCLPGGRELFVQVNGKFFPCEKVSENASVSCIGSLEEGFDFQQSKSLLNISSLTEHDCRNCWAIMHCNICADKATTINELSSDMARSHCRDSQLSLENNLKDILAIQETKDIISRYLSDHKQKD